MRSVREIILARRSVRRYLPTPLSRETVEELLEAGRYAPSGHNKQAWRFTAILDQKQELNQLVRAGFAALALGEDAPKELRDAKAKAERQGESYHFTYDAPCLIIASNDTSDPNAQASCACALENMFLMAHDLGIGSVWINQLGQSAPLAQGRFESAQKAGRTGRSGSAHNLWQRCVWPSGRKSARCPDQKGGDVEHHRVKSRRF